MFVSDLRHFLDMPDDVPAPARWMAEHLSLVVRAATAGGAGVRWVSALPCGRRPGHRRCPGHIAVFRSDVPPSIDWACASCGDDGVISGWQGSPFDLRAPAPNNDPGSTARVVITAEVAATLRSLVLVDTASERLVFRASSSEDGIVLAATEDDLEELIGYLPAEANHEGDRRRQKRLDTAFETLNDALESHGT